MLTAIFIDGGYLDKCANPGIDYTRLSSTLAGDERILQTYYYNGYPYDVSKMNNPDPKHIEVYEKKTKFFHGLEGLPKFTCRYGYTVFRNGEFIQKGVDSLLVVDMLTLAARKTVDSIKLLAGDRDLIAGVRAAREFGIVVDLFTFKEGTYAHALRGECDSCRKLSVNCTLVQQAKRGSEAEEEEAQAEKQPQAEKQTQAKAKPKPAQQPKARAEAQPQPQLQPPKARAEAQPQPQPQQNGKADAPAPAQQKQPEARSRRKKATKQGQAAQQTQGAQS